MKRILSILFLLPGLISCALGQDPKGTAYADLITKETSFQHLSKLASTEFQGRGTGQIGGKMAADYIAEHFKSYGLKAPVAGSFFQPLALEKTSFQVSKFELAGKTFSNGKDFYIQGAGKGAVNASEIIFVGYGISDAKFNELAQQDITGKVVLVLNEGEPQSADGNYILTGSKEASNYVKNRNYRLQQLMAKKPALILAASTQVPLLLTRMSDRITAGRYGLASKGATPAVANVTTPVANISPAMADLILAKGKTSIQKFTAAVTKTGKPQSGTIKTKLSTEFGEVKEALHDPNVLGLLEGTDLKDEVVVISGHYDHDGINSKGEIFFGADDNGSGTTAVLELARSFSEAKKAGKGPRRSILFIAFAAEEKGLLGSQYYAENPIFPLANTVTCLNVDMIGRIDNKHLAGNHNYIHVIGSDKLSSELYEINRQANADYTHMELDYMYDDPKDNMRIYYRSDQYNFAKHGIPVTFYFSGLHPHYHTTEDTVDKINFEMMVKREKLVFHVAWEVANRDKKLVVDSNKQ